MAARDPQHVAQRTLAMCYFRRFAQCADHGFFGSGAIANAFKCGAVGLSQAHGNYGHAEAVKCIGPEGVQIAGWQMPPTSLRYLCVSYRNCSIKMGLVLGPLDSSRSNKASACSRVTPAAYSKGVKTCSNGSLANTRA